MKKMVPLDIEKMSCDEFIGYRRETLEELESLGYQLLPTAGCSTCDTVNDYVCFNCECLFIDKSRDKYNATFSQIIKQQVEKLLEDYHPNEIGRLVGLPDNEAKKLVREIYFGWGYTEVDDWKVQDMGKDQFVLCLKQGDEWIDENGDYRYFDSKKEARSHLRKSLQLWHEQVALNTYS